MGSMQGIEGMEEFLLGTFLTYNKLYVIDNENIHVTVFLTQAVMEAALPLRMDSITSFVNSSLVT